jgi:hypothetical protein
MHQQFLEAIYAVGDEISGAFKIFEYVDDLIVNCLNSEDFSMCCKLIEELDLSKCTDGIALLFASALDADKDKINSYSEFFIKLKDKIFKDLPNEAEEILAGFS